VEEALASDGSGRTLTPREVQQAGVVFGYVVDVESDKLTAT
jgi:hypothetical protein